VIQTVMRHGSITLTMDTYGHLCPGQEADAVARLHAMMDDPPAPLAATGTDDLTANGAQHRAQHSGRETWQAVAMGCDQETERADASGDGSARPNVVRLANLGDDLRPDATGRDEGRAGDSNPQPLSVQLTNDQ
jgi:hypothetical protein